MADRFGLKNTMQTKTKIPSPSSTPLGTSTATTIKLQEMMEEYTEKIMQKVKQFTQDLLKELEKQIIGKVSQTIKALAEYLDDVADILDEHQKKCDATNDLLKEEISNMQSQMTMFKFERMQFALRVRNLPESPQEDLRSKIALSLAPVLNCDQGLALEELECAYRVNSKVAEQRNLPRDVVVYFCRKACRNTVIQRYYQQRFQIADSDILLLKEVPTAMLQKRKDYLFLTQELRRRKILYRWNIPVGLTVTFDNKRHKLNTVQEAKDFYTMMSGAAASEPEGVVELSTLLKDSLSIQDGKDTQIPKARYEPSKVKTRSMYKQKKK